VAAVVVFGIISSIGAPSAQNSLDRGLADAQKNYKFLQDQQRETSRELERAVAKLVVGAATSGPNAWSITKVAEQADKVLKLQSITGSLWDGRTNLAALNEFYLESTSVVADALAQLTPATKVASKIKGLALDLYELYLITERMKELNQKLAKAAEAVGRIEDKRNYLDARDFLDKIGKNLRAAEEAHAQHLAEQGVSTEDLKAEAMRKLEASAPGTSISIVDPDNIDDVRRMPRINPDAIRALECIQAQNANFAAMSHINCVRYDDWSFIPFFLPDNAASDNARLKGDEAAAVRRQLDEQKKRRANDDEELRKLRADAADFERQLRATRDGIAREFVRATEAARPIVIPETGSGPTVRVPADWVPCQCPNQHPNAGLLVNGTRWHSPLLFCREPEPLEVGRW
jgi:hypothetical protein